MNNIDYKIKLLKDLAYKYIEIIDKDLLKIKGTWCEKYYKESYEEYKNKLNDLINNDILVLKDHLKFNNKENIEKYYKNKIEYINDYLIEDYEIGHTGEMMNWRLNVIAIYTDLLLKLFKNY